MSILYELVNKRSFNKVLNLDQTSACFGLAKGHLVTQWVIRQSNDQSWVKSTWTWIKLIYDMNRSMKILNYNFWNQCQPGRPWQLHMQAGKWGRGIHKSSCFGRWPTSPSPPPPPITPLPSSPSPTSPPPTSPTPLSTLPSLTSSTQRPAARPTHSHSIDNDYVGKKNWTMTLLGLALFEANIMNSICKEESMRKVVALYLCQFP